MGGFTFSFFDKTMLWFQAWREKQVKINLSLKRVWQPRFSNDKDMISTGFLWLRTTIFMLHDMVYLFFFKGKTQFSMDEEQTQLLDLMLVYRSLRVRKPHTMDISTRNIHKIDDLSTINPKFGLMINQLTSRFGFPSCMVSRRLEETWWSVSCFFFPPRSQFLWQALMHHCVMNMYIYIIYMSVCIYIYYIYMSVYIYI